MCLMGTLVFLPGLHLLHSIPTHTRQAWWSGGVGPTIVELAESSTTASSGNFNLSQHEERPEQRPMARPDSGLSPSVPFWTSCGVAWWAYTKVTKKGTGPVGHRLLPAAVVVWSLFGRI
ncbi:hypothetical protein F5883DRAFT_209724 [Diaporthe sp. PMI_573]|nr:hypothetical protein F5883DRAFT_209724 [Diaporthaceae sp. PMI_573]